MNTAIQSRGALEVSNYAISFIDLLGQRNAVKGQQLLPEFADDAAREAFNRQARQSVFAIANLQRDVFKLIGGADDQDHANELRARLTPSHQALWDEMRADLPLIQRWSDGIVLFRSLAARSTRFPVAAIHRMLQASGAMVLVGLAREQPIRGAVDIAWGAELHPGEIYGPVVARAYELESEVASYPRIVVSEYVRGYLAQWARVQSTQPADAINKEFAKQSMNLLKTDFDGNAFIDYLGDGFRSLLGQDEWSDVAGRAQAFVAAQLHKHRMERNTKLAGRYLLLSRYFESLA